MDTSLAFNGDGLGELIKALPKLTGLEIGLTNLCGKVSEATQMQILLLSCNCC